MTPTREADGPPILSYAPVSARLIGDSIDFTDALQTTINLDMLHDRR